MKKKKKFIYICMYLYLVLFGFKTIVFAEDLNCNSWGRTLQDFKNIFNFLKIIVPLLVIGLSSYDFIKAITSKDDKGIKKAFNTFLKRLILAVIFFFLPVVINLFLDIAGVNSGVCIE